MQASTKVDLRTSCGYNSWLVVLYASPSRSYTARSRYILRCTRARLGRSFSPVGRCCSSAFAESISSASVSKCSFSICILHLLSVLYRLPHEVSRPWSIGDSSTLLHFCATCATLYARRDRHRRDGAPGQRR